MSLSLQFLGAAGTVTGSRHLLETNGKRILVDCGLFQGVKELRQINRNPFPVDPNTIHAVILTHAHLDHIGYLPILVREGFQGKIYCTAPTADLAEILLKDAAHIEEEDADYANRKRFSKHDPALPLFTVEEAHNAFRHFAVAETHQWLEIFPGAKFRFQPSGHILGSAFIELETQGKRFVFSGDLGRTVPLILNPRASLAAADYLVLESTYGDRLHSTEPPLEALRKVVLSTLEKKGHLLIPSFAVGRTQDLLYLFSQLVRASKIPAVPIYLDSPLATEATEILLKHPDWHRLNPQEAKSISGIAIVVKSQQQSKELLDAKHSTIVIAGSGMISGGRILHHLAHRVSDPRNTVLLVGYQAPGTRGSQMRDHAPELKMHGQYFTVKAELQELSGLSAHADQGETLTWLKGFQKKPQTTFLVHGEPQSADALRVKISDTLGWGCKIPKLYEKVELNS